MILSFGSAAGGGASAWLLPGASLLAALCYAAAAALPDRQPGAVRAAFVAAWMLHALAIVVDAIGAGGSATGARFGFAPALSVTLWLVLAVYGVESHYVALPNARRTLALMGVGAVMLALTFPGEFRPQASSQWAPLHWALGIASYGLFGVAVLHAVFLSRAERRMRGGLAAAPTGTGVPLLRLERLTFRFVGVGFAVLTLALALGFLFAQPWRWDHKSLLSMLGWAVFAGLLLGRRLFGWRGARATGWLYAGAALLLLAYVGSRFVLEVLLQRGTVS